MDTVICALTSDGLGRLKTVEELGTEDAQASTYATNYQYSALDKLVRVDQGVQRRCFVYDKGGRLTGAWNPEAGGAGLCDPASTPGAGWMRWEFDGWGNPTKQIWPSGKWKELHNYDALNRARGIRYSDVGAPNATRPVTFVFDSCALGVGRLCGTENGYSNEALSYDSGGAIVGSTQSTLATGTSNLVNYAFSYEHWANGVRKKMVYPSGREVEYDQDRRGRVVSAKGRAAAGGAQFDYVTAQSYHPHGALASVALGNGLTEEHCYNGRLQMTGMRLGTGGVGNCALAASDWWRMGLEYGATASANNGNVAEQTMTARLDAGGHWTRKQVFSYDGVNRLKRVEEQQVSGGSATSWAVDFGYDRYGNQWVPTATTNVSAPRATKQADYEAATNRIVKYWNDTTVPVGAYDGDGNWKDWLDVGVLTYDGENRVTKVVGTGGMATFEYDGQGRRVRKTAGGVETTFVYDADGEVAAEYGGTSTLVGRHFVTADHLGSTRVLTNLAGGRVHCADYLPFGEEIRTGTALSVRAGVACYGTGGMERKFTGKERDQETGLDYFGARYLSSAQGRFISLDPALESADEEDPQSWNRYVYTLNNPQKFVDPDGAIPVPAIIVGGSAAAGAVVGAAVGGWKGGWSGAVKGFVSGGIGGAAAGLAVFTGGSSLGALGAGITGGAVSGGVSGAVENAMEGRSLTHNAVANVAAGAIGGAAGAAAGKAIGAVLSRGDAELAKSVALSAADAAQAAGAKGGTVAGFARFGQTATGNSTRIGARNISTSVENTWNQVSKRSPYHLKCAEPSCVSNVSGPIRGGKVATAKVRPAGNPDHGTPHTPCTSCAEGLKRSGVTYVE